MKDKWTTFKNKLTFAIDWVGPQAVMVSLIFANAFASGMNAVLGNVLMVTLNTIGASVIMYFTIKNHREMSEIIEKQNEMLRNNRKSAQCDGLCRRRLLNESA